MQKIFGATLALVLMAASGIANAATVTTGTVYYNSAGSLGSYTPEGLYNQSGLSTGYISGVTDFDSYIASGVTHATSASPGGTWLSNGVADIGYTEMRFDLGAAMQISKLVLWNGSAGNDAALRSFYVMTSNDPDFGSGITLHLFENIFGNEGPEPATVFDMTDSTARYVRLQFDSYYGNPCCLAIGEIAFDASSVAPVPVPASLPLLLAGFGGLLALRRKSRKN
jgi:hypothetical protein